MGEGDKSHVFVTASALIACDPANVLLFERHFDTDDKVVGMEN